jgi:hypothetical protein
VVCLNRRSTNRLAKLRQEVEAVERVLNNEGVKRTPIPETVKLVVWARDQGRCVRCGSTKNLHFDHIIPVSKGGGNSEQNVQILCERATSRSPTGSPSDAWASRGRKNALRPAPAPRNVVLARVLIRRRRG